VTRRGIDGEPIVDLDDADWTPPPPERCIRHPWKDASRLGFCRACAADYDDIELLAMAAELEQVKR
jgi:hypothetical protein